MKNIIFEAKGRCNQSTAINIDFFFEDARNNLKSYPQFSNCNPFPFEPSVAKEAC